MTPDIKKEYFLGGRIQGTKYSALIKYLKANGTPVFYGNISVPCREGSLKIFQYDSSTVSVFKGVHIQQYYDRQLRKKQETIKAVVGLDVAAKTKQNAESIHRELERILNDFR